MAHAGKDPRDILSAGAEILRPTLEPHGFAFRIEREGPRSSGGPFAQGAFVSRKTLFSRRKRLEFHFRWSLGLVSYHVGRTSLSHDDYMRSLGVQRDAEYPGFSDEPLDAFRHLASDLARFCQDFVRGDGAQFRRFANEIKKNPTKFKELP